MLGAFARFIPKLGARLIPKIAPKVTAPAIIRAGGIEVPAAASALVRSGITRGGVQPVVQAGWFTGIPATAQLRRFLPLGAAAGVAGVVGWEALKAKLAPPKYDIPGIPGGYPPGGNKDDTTTPPLTPKVPDDLSSWLGSLLSNPYVAGALGLTGVGAAGYVGYKAYQRLKKRKKKVKVKRKAKRKYKVKRRGRKLKFGSAAYRKKYLGKGRKKRKGITKKGKWKRGSPKSRPGMKHQQALMRKGAKAWRSGRKLAATYRAHIKQYLQKG